MNHPFPRQSRRHHSSRGVTLVELLVVISIVGLLSALGGYIAYKKLRDDTRADLCIVNIDRLWAAKEAAWTRYEDLSTLPDPDAAIISYLKDNNLLFCPAPGTHRPTGTNPATVTNLLASYDLHATDEDAKPTCRIHPTTHVKSR